MLDFGSDSWGGHREGIEAHTSIKTSDYGFGCASKTGVPVDDIEVILLIEDVKLPAEIVIK